MDKVLKVLEKLVTAIEDSIEYSAHDFTTPIIKHESIADVHNEAIDVLSESGVFDK